MSPVGKMRLIITLLLIIRISSSDFPSISLLQETPSSLVTCHATSYYPEEAELFWAKNGKELHEGVVIGDTVPNSDGTFQKSATLNVSSIPADDWETHTCVFHFTETKEIISTQLNKKDLQTEITYPVAKFPIGLVIGAIVGFLIIAIVFAGVCQYKKSVNGHILPCGHDTMI